MVAHINHISKATKEMHTEAEAGVGVLNNLEDMPMAGRTSRITLVLININITHTTSNQNSMAHHAVCVEDLIIPPNIVPQSWGDRSDTKHSKCLLLGGRRLNQLTLIPKPKGSGGARAATAQVGPANNRNDTKRCLPIEASLRPGEAVPW